VREITQPAFSEKGGVGRARKKRRSNVGKENKVGTKKNKGVNPVGGVWQKRSKRKTFIQKGGRQTGRKCLQTKNGLK